MAPGFVIKKRQKMEAMRAKQNIDWLNEELKKGTIRLPDSSHLAQQLAKYPPPWDVGLYGTATTGAEYRAEYLGSYVSADATYAEDRYRYLVPSPIDPLQQELTALKQEMAQTQSWLDSLGTGITTSRIINTTKSIEWRVTLG